MIEGGLIKTKYQIISNGISYQTDELNARNIREGFVIY